MHYDEMSCELNVSDATASDRHDASPMIKTTKSCENTNMTPNMLSTPYGIPALMRGAQSATHCSMYPSSQLRLAIIHVFGIRAHS